MEHCFPINNQNDPNIRGSIKEVIDTYKRSVEEVNFAGPTKFAPILKKFQEQINQYAKQKVKKYGVLLLLTDGAINDMEETKELIVQLSKQACSIIIIGVGTADFTDMIDELDSPDGLLQDENENQCVRDMV